MQEVMHMHVCRFGANRQYYLTFSLVAAFNDSAVLNIEFILIQHINIDLIAAATGSAETM
jgi:hypothetical protein